MGEDDDGGSGVGSSDSDVVQSPLDSQGDAVGVIDSIDKGQRVIVTGALRIREWENGERTGTSVEVEADAIGHNLTHGTTQFIRTSNGQSGTSEPEPETAAEETDIAELRAKLSGE